MSTGALPDLSQCEREPIHIPGSIQPHGVLLAASAQSGRISQVSENAADLFGTSVGGLLGERWSALLETVIPLETTSTSPWHSAWTPIRLLRSPEAGSALGNKRWNAAFHVYDDHTLIELAPQSDRFDEDPQRRIRELRRQIEDDRSIDAAAARTARSLRNHLGYDRVMIYQFDPDWNGEVIAESLKRGLEPYLGLHYPSTDIPAQARALYLRNRVRGITNVKYTPSPIVPVEDPVTGEPLDLSDISLRSVSPVHLEYLSNMGVTGTLVASIVVNGALWGLIACHHYAPHYADHDMRTLIDGAATALGSRVWSLQEVDQEALESNLFTVREKLITAFSESKNEQVDAERLGELAPQLLEVVDADGVAIFSGDAIATYGHTPDREALLRIRRELEPATADHDAISGVLHTSELGQRFPQLGDLTAVAAGLVFLPLSVDANDAILWTRREKVHDVRWGGNPHLSKLEVIPGARLSPRQSFSTWQETVRGRSRRWSPEHLESARSLRVLIELAGRRHLPRHQALAAGTLERTLEGVMIVMATDKPWHQSPITFVNRKLAALVGRHAHDLVGQPANILLQEPERQHSALTMAQQDLHRRDHAVVALELRHTDESTIHARLAIEPVQDEQGQRTHWLAIDHGD